MKNIGYVVELSYDGTSGGGGSLIEAHVPEFQLDSIFL